MYKRQDKNSHLLKKIAHNRGITLEQVLDEIERRKRILEWMLERGIKDYVEVCKIINEYYKNPEKILSKIGPFKKEIEKEKEVKEMEKREEKKEKKEEPRKIPMSEIFGFKIVLEK